MEIRRPFRASTSHVLANGRVADDAAWPSRREALTVLWAGLTGALLGGCRERTGRGGHGKPAAGRFAAADIQVIPIEVTVSVFGSRMTENTYVVANRRTRDALIIDPGNADPRIAAAVSQGGFRVRAILNTHGHLDHAGGNAALARRFGVPVWGPKADAALYPMGGLENEPTRWFAPGSPPALPDLGPGLPLARIPTPGHTPGSTCFRLGGELFTGDTLFLGNVGRTWGSAAERARDYRQEVAGIRERLLPLGDLRVWPGHGPPTTLDRERRQNRHLAPPPDGAPRPG